MSRYEFQAYLNVNNDGDGDGEYYVGRPVDMGQGDVGPIESKPIAYFIADVLNRLRDLEEKAQLIERR